MNQATAQEDSKRAGALRRATFELLEQHMARGPEEIDSEVITALQDAANRLGEAERALRTALDPSETPEREAGAAASKSNGASPGLPMSSDAAITLALAETLVPVASSRADEAERWLRIMREYGNVGDALEQLGMASGEFSTPSAQPRRPDPGQPDPVQAVAHDAARFAQDRGAPTSATVDLLFAVILNYGSLFDRALYSATNKSRGDLLAELEQRERVGRY